MPRTIASVLRESRGEMSQEAAAKIIGTQQSTFSKWENGVQSPSVLYLAGLERFTGIEQLELLKLIHDDVTKRGPQARKALALQLLAEAQRLLSDD